MYDYTEINVDSPLFKEALNLLDSEIKRIVEKIYNDEFKSGEVTLKLNIRLVEDFKEFPAVDDLGFKNSEIVYFNKPIIEHNVSTTLKKQFKEKGSISLDSEIKKIDGQFVLVPVKDPQLDMLADSFLD